MIASSSDPLGEGLVASLPRPGGNLTGITYAASPERFGKQLELLKQIAPATRRVGVWWDFDVAIYRRSWQAPIEQASRALEIAVLPPRPVFDQAGVLPALDAMQSDRANAMLVAMGGPTWRYAAFLADEAVRRGLATVSAFKEFTDVGGLISYGPDFPALYHRGAAMVDRILKGARPADMAIELPSEYELAVNTRTAKALGLSVPSDLLVRAHRVVR
jgi:putative ABC transport system substrate-binding protein